MTILTTTVPSFSGGANITEGDTTLNDVLTDHVAGIEAINTAQAAALAGAAAIVAGNTGIVKQSVTITQAVDLAGVADTTFTKNLGAALPANARLVGYSIGVTTLISGGAINAATVSIGVTGTAAAICAAVSVFTGQTGFPKAPTAGAKGYLMCPVAAAQPTVTVTSTAANLSAAVAGSLTIDLFYIVLA